MTGRTRVLLQARKHPMLPASHCQMFRIMASVVIQLMCISAKYSIAGIEQIFIKRNARVLQTGMERTSAGTLKMDGSGETNTRETEHKTISNQLLQVWKLMVKLAHLLVVMSKRQCQMLGKTTSVEIPSWCITVKSSRAGIKRTMFKRNARALHTGMELTSAGTFKMDGSGETNMSMQTERETIQGLQVLSLTISSQHPPVLA